MTDWLDKNGTFGWGLGVVLEEHVALPIEAVSDSALTDVAIQESRTRPRISLVMKILLRCPPVQPPLY